MVTNQIMKRDLAGSIVLQRTSDSFFCGTSLLEAYNSVSESKKRFKDFWENKSTKEFLNELENEILTNRGNSAHLKTHETTRGNKGGTWMHPYLFVKFAMWLSPKFELQAIKWIYDNLIDFRNQAGDYYKEMCQALLDDYVLRKQEKPSPFLYINEAKFLNQLCYDSNACGQRNILSEQELSLLNDLQRMNIKLLQSGKYNEKERKNMLLNYSYSVKLINS